MIIAGERCFPEGGLRTVLPVIVGLVFSISEADTLIVGDTSLVVYPAAGLIDYFRGRYLVLINKTETKADARAELIIRDAIGKVLSAAVAGI